MIRTVLGEVCWLVSLTFLTRLIIIVKPTGTSSKFANMTEQALHEFKNEHSVKLEKITKIPLEGDGMIECRVERYVYFLVDCAFDAELCPSRLYVNLKANAEWISDLHEADAIHRRNALARFRRIYSPPRSSYQGQPHRDFPQQNFPARHWRGGVSVFH